MEKSGYIYVLTNESFHMENWVKIGYAEDVAKRVKELSGTAVPLPYEVYCTYEIPRIKGVKDPDKLIHDLIQTLNPSLRISQNREFFVLYPWEAYNMLYAIAQMHGTTDKLSRNEDNPTGQDLQNDSYYSTDALFPPKSDMRKLFEKVKRLILSVNSSLEETPRQLYVTFKNGKNNTVSLWPKDGWIEVVLNAKRGQIQDGDGLSYDISNRKWSAAQYAFRFYDDTDEVSARKLIEQTIKLKK
ncbi:MAG: GIY-YIG nuclease family protein [Lachnospiraceae bacterium]|nr:GIY-YIG nuclease family protein [Lachnospiraceae bacterium]